MERKKASDFPQEVINLFDLYIHGDIDRRTFLDSAGKFAVGGLTAVGMLEALTPNYAFAQQVPKDDRRLINEYQRIRSVEGNGTVRGYLSRPASGPAKMPGVLVVHENRGLNPYIEDVVRRLAMAGFLAYGPDGLTSLGGYPGDDTKGQEMQATLDPGKLFEDFVAGAKYLKNRQDCTGTIGVVGFCYGGGVANQLAVRYGSDLAAAVPYYGAQPSAENTKQIKASLCLHYAGMDARITGAWPAYETALKAAGVKYEAYVYEGAQHGFHNDTTPRYDKTAAELSWSRTIAFFKKTLVTS